jgi:hypothetical protein
MPAKTTKSIKFEVVGAQWNGYPGGEHEVENPDPELVEAVIAADAATFVTLIEIDGHTPDVVESDEDSLAKYEAAQADGSWQEGNLADYEARIAATEAAAAEAAEAEETDEEG